MRSSWPPVTSEESLFYNSKLSLEVNR